jgi:hypothetical protein
MQKEELMDAIGQSIDQTQGSYAFSVVMRREDVLALIKPLDFAGLLLFVKVAFFWETLSPVERGQLLLDVITRLTPTDAVSAGGKITLESKGIPA